MLKKQYKNNEKKIFIFENIRLEKLSQKQMTPHSSHSNTKFRQSHELWKIISGSVRREKNQ